MKTKNKKWLLFFRNKIEMVTNRKSETSFSLYVCSSRDIVSKSTKKKKKKRKKIMKLGK